MGSRGLFLCHEMRQYFSIQYWIRVGMATAVFSADVYGNRMEVRFGRPWEPMPLCLQMSCMPNMTVRRKHKSCWFWLYKRFRHGNESCICLCTCQKQKGFHILRIKLLQGCIRILYSESLKYIFFKHHQLRFDDAAYWPGAESNAGDYCYRTRNSIRQLYNRNVEKYDYHWMRQRPSRTERF